MLTDPVTGSIIELRTRVVGRRLMLTAAWWVKRSSPMPSLSRTVEESGVTNAWMNVGTSRRESKLRNTMTCVLVGMILAVCSFVNSLKSWVLEYSCYGMQMKICTSNDLWSRTMRASQNTGSVYKPRVRRSSTKGGSYIWSDRKGVEP